MILSCEELALCSPIILYSKINGDEASLNIHYTYSQKRVESASEG